MFKHLDIDVEFADSTTHLAISRSPAIGSGGAVAAKMASAAGVGSDILRRGGNAIDAAVATAFAIGVVEPCMNGIGGGGYLVAWIAQEQRAIAIEFPMVSGSGATEDMYPLASGVDAGLFGWSTTVDNANVTGYRSIAVPGSVAGLATALERYGTMSLPDVIAPAIALAENGEPVTWHTTYLIARDLTRLRAFPATAEIYLDANGAPPVTVERHNPAMLRNPDLARTLQTIADDGWRTFYEGELAHTIVDHLAASGTPITREDFAGYQVTEVEASAVELAGHTVHTIGKGTGGSSLIESLGIYGRLDPADDAPGSALAYHKLAHAFRQAFADRFTYLADPDHVEVPLAAMHDPAYWERKASRFDPDRVAAVEAGSRDELGVTHALAASVPEYMRDGSTTHLGVIDREGNAVSLTQTLLSLWGSHVVVPGTGVLMNNGMMWFDPEPGRPNSVGPGKRPLSNMAPALLTKDSVIRASVGSSGGRKIMNCNAQILANLAVHGLPMGEALAAPRIDTSRSTLPISSRASFDAIAGLETIGHPVDTVDEATFQTEFASPVAIARDTDGMLEAAADAWYFPASAKVLP